jgi:hypothetical protein
MKTFNSISALILLFSGSALAFDLPGLEQGAAPARLPGAGLPSAAAPSVPGTPDALLADRLELLRAEALADPDKFVDEHTPAEVGMVFGLPASEGDASGGRFMIDNEAAKKAAVRFTVSLSSQTLTVEAADFNAVFKISSGLAPEHGTPGSGRCFSPDFMEEMHYSSLYNKAPMPNSIFFNGNIAMHATGAEALLGQPASHGCIRLSKVNAKTVYDLVKAHGKANASICVTGKTPVK